MISLVVGIDLSFNSTGLTLCTVNNEGGRSAEFHRLVFETKPTPIVNLNQHTYNLPTNVLVTDINDDENDLYSEDQALITIKSMVVCKRVVGLITKKLEKLGDNVSLYVNIEGFIMSRETGSSQLRVLGGLIMMQGMIRSEIIRMKIGGKLRDFKLYITSPSNLKKYFTGHGDADKDLMVKHFNETFDGHKLLPDTKSIGKINDVVDSFALMLNCFHRVFYPESYKSIMGVITNRKKKRKKKPTPHRDIIKNSIPTITI